MSWRTAIPLTNMENSGGRAGCGREDGFGFKRVNLEFLWHLKRLQQVFIGAGFSQGRRLGKGHREQEATGTFKDQESTIRS